MSASVTVVSEWNSGISATIYQIGGKFCMNMVSQNGCLSVRCGLDDMVSMRDWLNEQIAEAKEDEVVS